MTDEANAPVNENSPIHDANPAPPPPPANPPAVASPAPAANAVDNRWPVLNLQPEDLQSYMSINDSIHIFEWAVLKFYASANSPETRTSHARHVTDELNNLKKSLIGEGCPDGYMPSGDGKCIRNG